MQSWSRAWPAAPAPGARPRPARGRPPLRGRPSRARPAAAATIWSAFVPQVCAPLGGSASRPADGGVRRPRGTPPGPALPLRPAVTAGPAAAEVDGGMSQGLGRARACATAADPLHDEGCPRRGGRWRLTLTLRARESTMSDDCSASFHLGCFVFKDAEIVELRRCRGSTRSRSSSTPARRLPDRRHDAPGPTPGPASFAPQLRVRRPPGHGRLPDPSRFGTRRFPPVPTPATTSYPELPESCLLTSVCAGSSIYGAMGLLDGPISDQPPRPEHGWKPGRARCPSTGSPTSPRHACQPGPVVDSGRMVAAGASPSGMEISYRLLRRAGWSTAGPSPRWRGVDGSTRGHPRRTRRT